MTADAGAAESEDAAPPPAAPPPAPLRLVDRLRRIPPAWMLAGLIVLHAALLTWSALANSVAFDEYAHLPAGASYVRYRHFGMLNLTPPLVKALAATPVVLAGAEVPPLEPFADMVQKDRYWAFAEAFMRVNAARYHRLFVLGRLPIIAVSCVGLWLVYRWARELYGPHAALLAATVYALCPNFCAHASLVGTDAPTAVAFLAAAYLWWRFCRDGRWPALAGAAITAGVAHLCKFNAVLLWPVMIAMGVAAVLAHSSRPWKRVALGFIACGVGSVIVFNAGYLFEGTGKRAGEYALQSRAMTAVFSRLPARLPVPFPEQAVLGFDALKWEVEQGFSGFLFGRQYRGSRWYYFPVALLLKLPLATLALLALTLLSLLRPHPRELPALVAAAVFLLGMMLAAEVNLGVRYVLPALPFAFVLIGRTLAATHVRWLVPALLALLAVENVAVAPRYLTFFNALAGGPSRGQFLLNDSNFDWGQGLLDLKTWLADNDVSRVQLGYFGRVDPAVYGIDYHLITEVSGAPHIAVSSYFLAGLTHRLPSRSGPTGPVRLEFAEQLRRKPRVATVAGGAIHIFRREDVAAAMAEARAKASAAGR